MRAQALPPAPALCAVRGYRTRGAGAASTGRPRAWAQTGRGEPKCSALPTHAPAELWTPCTLAAPRRTPAGRPRCRAWVACASTASSSAPAPARPPLVQGERSSCKLVYLYDGSCRVCLALVDMLRGRGGGQTIYYENIVSESFSADANAGISKEDAMATIHVIKPDGRVVKGMEALTLLYDAVGLGWLFQLAKLPGLSQAAELVYKLVSKNRSSLSSGMDGISGGLLSLSRIAMEERGEGSCAEDGECREGYSKIAPETPPAAAAAAASVGAVPSAEAASAGAGAAAPAEKLRGSAIDREHILGVYYSGRSEQGAYLRAAPVEVATGKLLGPEELYPLASSDVESVIEGTKALLGTLQWDGVVGVGLPGLLRNAHETSPSERGTALASDITMAALARRRARVQTEQEMQEATERELTVMTGAEANGYGEMLFGAGKGELGLVMMVTLSRGIGVALFDDGVLLRNVETADHTWTWNLAKAGGGVSLPLADTPQGAPSWTAWAQRVQAYLCKLDSVFSPDLIIIGGAAGEVAPSWLHLVQGVRAPLRRATLGSAAGILGSAAGGKQQIALRDDLSRVRAAIGRTQGVSPQLLTREEVRKVFDSFDTDKSGVISPKELAAAVRALGVRLPDDELRVLLIELDSDNSGEISFLEFATWWEQLVTSSPVTYLHTEAEFDNILDEEATSGRLVVLEVGFTFCRPCKKFEPRYKDFANHYPDARFLRVNGNENADMVHLGRDRLKLKSSPSFFFYINGSEVHRHTGAAEDKFQRAILPYFPLTPPMVDLKPEESAAWHGPTHFFFCSSVIFLQRRPDDVIITGEVAARAVPPAGDAGRKLTDEEKKKCVEPCQAADCDGDSSSLLR